VEEQVCRETGLACKLLWQPVEWESLGSANPANNNNTVLYSGMGMDMDMDMDIDMKI